MPKIEPVIRELSEEDFQHLGEITYAAYQTIEGLPTNPENPFNADLLDVAGRAAVEGNLILGAYDSVSGGLLGGVTLCFERYSTEPEYLLSAEAGIRMLAVSQQTHGAGIGRKLVQECINRARSAGRQGIILHTIGAMKSARKLYESLGFHRDITLDAHRGGIDINCYKLRLEN